MAAAAAAAGPVDLRDASGNSGPGSAFEPIQATPFDAFQEFDVEASDLALLSPQQQRAYHARRQRASGAGAGGGAWAALGQAFSSLVNMGVAPATQGRTDSLLDTTTSSSSEELSSSELSSELSSSEDEEGTSLMPAVAQPAVVPRAYAELLQRFGETPSVPLARRE